MGGSTIAITHFLFLYYKSFSNMQSIHRLRITSIIFIASFNIGQSQSLQDALRFSIFDQHSTARSAGVSGAFSALGADLSVASTNPAGIAEFRKSEYTISFGVPFMSSDANLSGTSTSENRSGFKLDNLGAVFFYSPANFNVKSSNIAVGVNKISDFTSRFRYSGITPGTITERFLERATGQTPAELDAFEGGPAFDAGVIYNFDNGSEYQTDFTTFNESIFREQSVSTRGTMHELFITYASNVKNKFSYGVTLGIPFVNLHEEKFYDESDPNSQVPIFESLSFVENLSLSGAGINLKAGIIYKINLKTRVALAVHSPSWLILEDEYSTAINYSINSPAGLESFSGQSGTFEPFSYNLRTPFRAILGLSHIFSLSDKVKGFVSADGEYVDFTSIAFDLTSDGGDPLDQFVERDLNALAKNSLARAFNVRLGSELAYDKWRFRAGARMNATPTVNSTIGNALGFSLGLGYRGQTHYIDLSAQLVTREDEYTPYILLDNTRNQQINVARNAMGYMLTYGRKI